MTNIPNATDREDTMHTNDEDKIGEKDRCIFTENLDIKLSHRLPEYCSRDIKNMAYYR